MAIEFTVATKGCRKCKKPYSAVIKTGQNKSEITCPYCGYPMFHKQGEGNQRFTPVNASISAVDKDGNVKVETVPVREYLTKEFDVSDFKPRGDHFLDDLIAETELSVKLIDDDTRRYQLQLLKSEDTKLLMFDARQAQLFDDMNEKPPKNIQEKLHMPFDQMFIEFSEPILCQGQEPERRDYLRGILITKEKADVQIPWQDERNGELRWLTLGGRQIFVFLTARDEFGYHEYIDRSFTWNLETGWAFTTCGIAREEPDPSEIPDDWKDEDRILAGGKILSRSPIFRSGEAPDPVENRHIGWWENAICSYSSLISWVLTYTMAKSVKVLEIQPSRQQRRWMERKNIKPKPWHMVKVEPKFVHRSGKIGPEQEPSWRHSYRYDVIGFLRFGRHKKGDGSYSETIEWVAPHQRGLANDLYVPSTHKVERGKVISKRMKSYFGSVPDVK